MIDARPSAAQPRWRRAWRVLNTAVILVAFFAPWLRGCDPLGGPAPPVSGFLLARTAVDLLVAFRRTLLVELFEPDSLAPLIVSFVIGVLGLWAYVSLNLIQALTGRLSVGRTWRLVALAAGVAGLLWPSILRLISGGSFLWGFWLNWAGIGSSLILEITDNLERRRLDSTTLAPSPPAHTLPPGASP
jgi:hypothetical protein